MRSGQEARTSAHGKDINRERHESTRTLALSQKDYYCLTKLKNYARIAFSPYCQRSIALPEICRFFGIVVRMFYDDHNPPHIHVEYQGNKAVFDLRGNVSRGDLKSRTAVRLVREWIDLRTNDLEEDWALAQEGKELNKILPLD